jgi:serine/threonine protein kinase/Tfp pilus assembly protein PilF
MGQERTMHDCPTGEQFEKCVRGELGQIELHRMREHLDGCEKCQAAYERRQSSDPLPGADATQAVVRLPKESPSSVEKAPQYLPNIEGFRITGVLGQGGMGIVYRAVQTKLNRAVALKVLPSIVGSASPSAVQRFRREATAAARLHHTNIVPIYDFGECRDAYYYTMELIDGQPLNEMIKTFAEQKISSASPARLAAVLQQSTRVALPMQPVQEDAERSSISSSSSAVRSSSTGRGRAYYQQVAHWIADAANALHYAHGQGIIHRDIKPGNLIVSNDGRIMITDFGLAMSSDEKSMTITGSLLGTMRYLSPEQAMAKRMPVDHRTDIYSLGATLYELLTFQPAFPGTDEKQILAAIITRDPAPPRKITPQVPAELETICLKTLEKSADARYESAQALAEDLRRYLNDLPIVAKRPNSIRRMAKFVKRHRAPVIAVIAVVLVVFAAIGYSVAVRRQHAAVLESYLSDGERLQAAERWMEAAEVYQAALKLEPNNIAVLGNLARILMEQYERQAQPDVQLIDGALAYCERAMQTEPDRPRLANLYGVLLSMRNRFDEAIDAFGQAAASDPNEAWVFINYGAVEFLRGDFVKAEAMLQESTKNNPKLDGQPYCHGWRELATLQLYLGRSEAAASIDKAFECGVGTVPWYYLVRARLRLTLAGFLDAQGALSDAQIADGFAGGKDGVIKRYLALAYLRNARFGEAITKARDAIEFGDPPSCNFLLIAQAEERRGNHQSAQDAYNKALTLWPSELREPGASHRTRRLGSLWFESAGELLTLRDEAEEVLARPVSPS